MGFLRYNVYGYNHNSDYIQRTSIYWQYTTIELTHLSKMQKHNYFSIDHEAKTTKKKKKR